MAVNIFNILCHDADVWQKEEQVINLLITLMLNNHHSYYTTTVTTQSLINLLKVIKIEWWFPPLKGIIWEPN